MLPYVSDLVVLFRMEQYDGKINQTRIKEHCLKKIGIV